MNELTSKAWHRLSLMFLICLLVTSWHIAAYSDDKGSIVGTAFFIQENGVMLTNKHVVKGCKRIYVKPEDGNYYRAKIIATSEKYDLAALQSYDYKPITFAPMRAAQDRRHVSLPADGEEVITGGFSDPQNMNFLISIVDGVALVIKENGDHDSVNSIMLSSVQQGASGSPIIDYSGNLIGIIHSGIEDLPKNKKDKTGKHNSLVIFHNNNAIADFLTTKDIHFNFRVGGMRLTRLELVGIAYNVTALVNCKM